MPSPALSQRLAAAKFRAWHRGTREADYVIGGYFDAFHAHWSDSELFWFEALLDAEDVDILGWALGTIAPPAKFAGPMMDAMRKLDYVRI